MRGEHVITNRELQTRFQGEHDLVTLAPYEVGDRIVRCWNCRAIVKSEFVSSSTCPICGNTPFVAAPIEEGSNSVIHASRNRRSLTAFTWALLISTIIMLIPFLFPTVRAFLSEATFGLSVEWLILLALVLSVITMLILRLNNNIKRAWQNSRAGWLFSFIPAAVPYAALCSIWIVIFAVQLILSILAVGIVVAIIVGVCGGFDH